MKTFATLVAACLTLVLQGTFAAAHANNTDGHCTGMTVTDFVSSDVTRDTTSTTYVNVIDGHLNFTTSATGCVAITFSGVGDVSNSLNGFAYMFVRALLDGNQLCVPAATSPIFLGSGQPRPVVAASFTHVCKNVAAGTHTVQVQFSVDSTNDEGELVGHVLTVTHN
jgi:hypothetical protein